MAVLGQAAMCPPCTAPRTGVGVLGWQEGGQLRGLLGEGLKGSERDPEVLS